MDIKFEGKYKSITSFHWEKIPDFVVITGPNGTGKSQLLDLIYNSVINKQGTSERVIINGKTILPNEVTFLRGEWQLQNTAHTDLATLQNIQNSHYQDFKQHSSRYMNAQHYDERSVKLHHAFKDILKKSGKYNPHEVSKEEFIKYYPEILIEQESQISQKISELFYNYRLSEIELLAKGKSQSDTTLILGKRPWEVLREIIKAAKLPFEINDPSINGFREVFQLQLQHQILNEQINFNDLSSGEKVLISLVFYMYNSQERNVFPKLLLLDEPDAHLHPSMSQQFLNVIKNVLVDKFGTQVIMTTHSPSTVILSPEESIYEMSRTNPRIKKSPSKNHAVALLTSGLIYVGEGTKYFLVEDNDDSSFYSYVYNQLSVDNQIDSNVPLVFIPASTKDNAGGKNVVQNWVKKLQETELISIVHGLIDADNGNEVSKGVYKIDRYSIENYLADPILVYAALLDREKNPKIEGLSLGLGEEYVLKSLPDKVLQTIADLIISMVEVELKKYFTDFDAKKETKRVEIEFVSGAKLSYPHWLINRPGKSIINVVYNKIFSGTFVNAGSLFRALRKLNMFPKELANKFSEISRPIE